MTTIDIRAGALSAYIEAVASDADPYVRYFAVLKVDRFASFGDDSTDVNSDWAYETVGRTMFDSNNYLGSTKKGEIALRNFMTQRNESSGGKGAPGILPALTWLSLVRLLASRA